MKMNRTDPDMTELDALLAQARDIDTPTPLMGRVLEDALAQQPVPRLRVAPTIWAQLANVLGGWQGMGGLVAATCAGLWIGISPPQALPESIIEILGTTDSYVQQDPSLSGFGWDVEEG
jgi:hypothetical protein